MFLNVMVAVTIHSNLGSLRKQNLSLLPLFPLVLTKWRDQLAWFFFFFWYWVLSHLFHSPFLPSSGGSLFPLHFMLLEWYHLHIWGCWYFSQQSRSSLGFIHPGISHDVLCIEVEEARWQYTALTYSFSNFEPVHCSTSGFNHWFLICIQVSQEAGKVVWYHHLLKNFPPFVVIHRVKGFGIVNEAEGDVFLEFCCFFNDPTVVGNLISDSFVFSEPSLYIWKFSVYVLLKPSLKYFGHNFTRMWNEGNCTNVLTFFFWHCFCLGLNENWPFPV